jgi:hypothetical protein
MGRAKKASHYLMAKRLRNLVSLLPPCWSSISAHRRREKLQNQQSFMMCIALPHYFSSIYLPKRIDRIKFQKCRYPLEKQNDRPYT